MGLSRVVTEAQLRVASPLAGSNEIAMAAAEIMLLASFMICPWPASLPT